MLTIWFMIVAVMLAAYVILDGFDIGAGIVHYFVGRDQRERETVISAVGPVCVKGWRNQRSVIPRPRCSRV